MWECLAETPGGSEFEDMIDSVLPLADIETVFKKILEGRVCGRIVVDIGA